MGRVATPGAGPGVPTGWFGHATPADAVRAIMGGADAGWSSGSAWPCRASTALRVRDRRLILLRPGINKRAGRGDGLLSQQGAERRGLSAEEGEDSGQARVGGHDADSGDRGAEAPDLARRGVGDEQGDWAVDPAEGPGTVAPCFRPHDPRASRGLADGHARGRRAASALAPRRESCQTRMGEGRARGPRRNPNRAGGHAREGPRRVWSDSRPIRGRWGPSKNDLANATAALLTRSLSGSATPPGSTRPSNASGLAISTVLVTGKVLALSIPSTPWMAHGLIENSSTLAPTCSAASHGF